MEHALKISVSNKPVNVACRRVTVRERLLRFLLGRPVRLTVLVPGDSVDEVAISEIRKGGGEDDDAQSVCFGA